MRRAALGLLAALAAATAARGAADADAGVAASTQNAVVYDAAMRYKSEGPVVDNAASFIGIMTAIPSAVVGAVACPVKLAGDKIQAGRTYGERYKDCVAAGTATGSQFFYTVGGYPFLVLKRVLWDAPRRALRGPQAPKPAAPAAPAAPAPGR